MRAWTSSIDSRGSGIRVDPRRFARYPGVDRIGRVAAPLVPAAVVDGDPRPAEQPGIEEGLAPAPACAAVEGVVRVRGDADGAPGRLDLAVLTACVIEVAVVLHVVGVAAALGEDGSADAPLLL